MQISTLICILMASLTITACSNPLFAYNAPPPKFWEHPNGGIVTTCSGGGISESQKKYYKGGYYLKDGYFRFNCIDGKEYKLTPEQKNWHLDGLELGLFTMLTGRLQREGGGVYHEAAA